VADDDRVVRDLDSRRWQLAHNDLALGHQHLAGHRQLVIDQPQVQVRGNFQCRVGLDGHGQLLALQTQVHAQGLAPGQLAVELAAPGIAAAPAAVDLHLLASDQGLQRQVLQADRQLGTTDLAPGEHQVAVDLWCQQGAGQAAAAIQLPGQAFDHRHERTGNRHIQPGETEVARQRLVLAQRIEARVQAQLTQALTAKIQARIDPAWRQGAVQPQGLVREVDPAAVVANAQRTATGIDTDVALRAAGGNVQVHVGIEHALPGEVLRQPLRQAIQRELLEVVA